MICFSRDFGYVSIVIKIENNIYFKQKNTFDSLFFTYDIEVKNKNKNIKIIYILNSEDYDNDSPIMLCDYYHLCDFNIDNWLNILINFLEYCYEKILMCTILHGSCVVLNNKGIMLLGKSKSGKSTLTYHLIHENNAQYLDDDVIYLVNNSFIGFNSPMRMRQKCNNFRLLEIEKDIDDVSRYTYDIENNQKIDCIEKISYIIFPKYQSDVDFQISEIDKYTLTNNIIANIKGTPNMTTVFKDMSKCFTNLKAYEIKYNNCNKASGFLNTI